MFVLDNPKISCYNFHRRQQGGVPCPLPENPSIWGRFTEASCAQFTDLFVSREERLVAVLGNDTVQTFFSTGSLADGFVVLSSRRVYFSGRCLLRTGKRFSTIKEERIVDVDSVTGTDFVHADPIWKRLAAITLLLVSLASFVYLISGSGDHVTLGIVGFLTLLPFCIYGIRRQSAPFLRFPMPVAESALICAGSPRRKRTSSRKTSA